ncbi:MAG: tRNA (adenosine(37)-N6)-threonylcarbamoyltransferase complex dimerization subunit type 1 TsaB [Bacteroidetes bacterium 4572_117]|nr:MAG: tRNA (adenosine(37)-N6)-threonylcarbamoyltransferase complex dimerization subunit type 1 TsaB [Bacteroidetes bacterium 4572_117]
MALILNIETSTEVCSVCFAQDGKVIALKENNEGQTHAKLLTVFIEDLLKEKKLKVADFDAVAVSMGPGSYTGLRIGVSTAKGLAYAANIPLIAINTLQSIADGLVQQDKQKINQNAWVCPMIDARRMEVYTAFFNIENVAESEISADIIDENSYQKILDDRQVVFCGNGSAKCKDTIKHKNAIFVDDIECSSSYMALLAEKAFLNSDFVDVAYFEPYYLKNFVATIPKKNIFK